MSSRLIFAAFTPTIYKQGVSKHQGVAVANTEKKQTMSVSGRNGWTCQVIHGKEESVQIF